MRHILLAAGAILALFLIWAVVWLELMLKIGLSGPVLAALFVFFAASFASQLIYIFKIRKPGYHPRFIFFVFFVSGLFIHLFCAAVTKDALLFIPALQPHEQSISVCFVLLAFIFNLWGIKSALQTPRLRHVHVPLPSEHKNLDGFKIIQISDLHVSPQVTRAFVRRVVRRIMSAHPDLIVMTGDIGDSTAEIFGTRLEPFKDLQARCGAFYVTGNHEYYWDAKKWIEAIRSNGVRPLLNEGVSLLHGKIWLGGITDPDGPHFIPEHVPDCRKALEPEEKSNPGYKILLAHQPKNCFAAEKAGFDLMLSGHTHGGQFFPFNLIVGFFNPYSKGLNCHGKKLRVYVNQGTGFWGPAQRLGVRAEITLLELKA